MALALAFGTAPLAAQDRVDIAPEQARQCALWASYVASELEQTDPQGFQALNFATNYFVGYYEGKSGRSMASSTTAQDAQAMVENIEAVSDTCLALMAAWGDRMIAWGDALDAAAQRGN